MSMEYNLRYHPDVKKKDIPKLDGKTKSILKKAIEERLARHPEKYGQPLRRTLKGYWKLRIGDYRVVFRLSGDTIIILAILHRKDVYMVAQQRSISQ